MTDQPKPSMAAGDTVQWFPGSQSPPTGTEPAVAVPLNEWSLLHRRLGFLEGALTGLRYTEDLNASLDQVELGYKEMK